MRDFDSVDELISYLRTERNSAEGFVARFILVQGCRAWDELLPRLEFEVDHVVRLSEFCSGPDVFPDVSSIKEQLSKILDVHSQVMIVPLAECIRLNPEMLEVIGILASVRSDKNRRVYVPLLAGEEMLDEKLRHVARYRAGLLPEPWSVAGEGKSDIIAAPFLANAGNRRIARGIKNYLSLWERQSMEQIWLVTEMAPWLPTHYMRNDCRVRLYPSSYDYVARIPGMTDISKEQGTDEQWEWLASFVWEKDTLDSLASRILNVNGFDPDQVLSAWSTADSKLRWLIWIWVRARSAQGTYLHFVAGSTSSVNELPLAAVMGIFSLPRSCRTSTERRALLEKLKVSSMPNQYWLRYRDLSDHIDKLAVLSGITREEREEIIRCVAALDGLVPRDQWYDFLQVSFPTFAWYLDGFSTGNEFVDGYFQDYRSCRVKDKTSDGLAERIHTWSVDQVLWDFTPRAAAIEAIRQGGVRVIWVDGMGVEWAGLVHSFITSHSGTSCDVSVVRAQLPTTTDANNEWVESEMPERAIDDAAHHYGYAYPRSFLDQFEAVEQICQKAINVLSQEDAVVITSDHGLSRFAAMGGEKVEPPPGAEVIAPGRYARLKDDCQVSSHKWLVDNGKAVLLTHAQFTGGGPRHGEVHGGATPEEILVPLFTIRRVGATLMPSIKALSEKIRLNPRGEGVLAIEASMPLDCLRLRVGGRSIVGEKRDELTWSFKLNGLKQGGHSGTVYWGVRRVGSISFVVTRGLVEDDMGIRGGQKS